MSVNDQPIPFRPQTHILAIISLVLSLLGLVPILPVVGAIGGIITGTIARREIRQRPEQYSGEGVAKAGVILGWVGIGLTMLICLLGLAFFIFSVRTSQGIIGPTISITTMPPIQIQP